MIRVVRFVPDGPFEVGGEELLGLPPAEGELRWIDLEGADRPEITRIGERFGLHPLAIDDCLSLDHQPKIDDYGDHLFVIARGVDPTPGKAGFVTTKLASFLSDRWLVTFHRLPLLATEEVRAKVGPGAQRLFELGCDQVFWALTDRLVDGYFPALDELGDELEELEEQVFVEPAPEVLERLLAIRRDLLHLRRHAAPQRDLFGRLSRGDHRFIDAKTAPYFRDVYDHTFRIAEMVDNLRDLTSGILEAYLSIVTNRTNETMRVLTVITTIFIPLTFLAGVYGMNFRYMPELEWRYAYPALWIIMVILAGGMILLFRRRRWL